MEPQEQGKKQKPLPPVKNRWKPGQSGNPGGKPKGLKNYKTIIETIGLMPAPKEMVEKICEVFPAYKRKTLTMKEAATLKAYIDCLKGDDKAREFLAEREEGKASQTITHKGDLVRNISVRDSETANNLKKLRGEA